MIEIEQLDIVRRVDDPGRIELSTELRDHLGSKARDALEMYLADVCILLKKPEPTQNKVPRFFVRSMQW